MVDGEASIHNIMGGMESTGGVRLHNHKRKLKQRFDIIKKLGQGTYGKVQLGINKETGQEVAIKTIKKCKIETEADLIRIRREIQIMSSVQHPNIIHIYEVFENREKMVLVMEYAAGGELYDYLSEHKVLTELEARRIFRQISTAVFYCHKHKICHRDLKLENILLDQSGNAKIADFGLSNVFDERRLLKTFCGSALYASPEIVNGTPYRGPEVDCWSLGVLLYTLVYGAMPFDGTNFKRLVKQISESDYREPKKPSRASPLIKVMLAVNPSQRVDIEKICRHWWVNEGYEQNCLDVAEDLAAQTPVRLDLLLSLVPQSASAEKLVVCSDEVPQKSDITNVALETLGPTRSHSVGSLIELDQKNSGRRIREMIQEDTKTNTKTKSVSSNDTKRKLETTPSTEEATAATVKKKENHRGKDSIDDRNYKAYKICNKHHSAPISNSILEEAMEIDSNIVISVPTSKTVDLKKTDESVTCLDVKEIICKENLASNERIKSSSISDYTQNLTKDICKNYNDPKKLHKKKIESQELASPAKKNSSKLLVEEKNVGITDAQKEKSLFKVKKIDSNKTPIQKDNEKVFENIRQPPKDAKKLRNKSLSLDCDLISDEIVTKASTERRRSKIFETAEKFNQLASPVEVEKPKKIFIPGVNVGGAKLVFERKASLSASTVPQHVTKAPVTKMIIDVPVFDKVYNNDKAPDVNFKEKNRKRDEEKKRAVDIITEALGKPPMLKKASGSPPISPQGNESKKLGLKIPLGPNDVRNATVTVTTPTETKFPFASKPDIYNKAAFSSLDTSTYEISKSAADEQNNYNNVEVSLKSATLPRPHKTSKAKIILTNSRPIDMSFRTEVEAKIDSFQPQKLRTQRSEVAFPIAAATPPQTYRSSSLEPTTRTNNRVIGERIVPIQKEPILQQATIHSTTPPPKPPLSQRSVSQRSISLSRQSTADSDTDSALGSTLGPEPIRKSPREYIIPIVVEGGGYVTPRSGSLESETKSGTTTSSHPPHMSRFVRPRRISSFLSDASEDELSFSSVHRDNDDLLQRHMHRLRSSRPPRQVPEHTDSLSSGEDDDDDGFELLTAENLFTTLLSRVRSLTQRLNVDDNRSGGPSSRILGRLRSNSPQNFWGVHEPFSRRIPDSQFRRTTNRNNSDFFGSEESPRPSSPDSQQTRPQARTPSHDSVFDKGNTTNILPKVKVQQPCDNPDQSSEYTSELNFTPCLARRLSRHFIERTRQSLPSDGNYRSLFPSPRNGLDHFRSHSQDRTCEKMRRSNSLLEPTLTRQRHSPRRSISLFDDEDRYLPPLPLNHKYKDSGKLNSTHIAVDKIQEEQLDELAPTKEEHEDNSLSKCTSFTVSNYSKMQASNKLVISRESSPSGSTSNILDYNSLYRNSNKTSNSLSNKDLHNRLLTAENLIKESKIKNLGLSKYNPNLNSNYKDLDKCDKESLGAIAETASAAIANRRSCIPSFRHRSSSFSRENSLNRDSTSFDNSKDTMNTPCSTGERSLLSKLFKNHTDDTKDKYETQHKPKPHPRRISRFLRPDFFDTPREESQYVKEREAQKVVENERRKSRFTKRKIDSKNQENEKINKDAKNEAKVTLKCTEDELKSSNVKSSFLQTLEKKLEKFRSVDDDSKTINKTEINSVAQIKLTTSADNLLTNSSIASVQLHPKSKVNSVLGLFKNSDPKSEQSSSPSSRLHGQTILSRLRNSPSKVSKSDDILAVDNTFSKIPTKFSKFEVKSNKKLTEVNKSSEKNLLGFRISPSKEKEKEISSHNRVSSDTKKSDKEKLSKLLKKSPEKLLKGKLEKIEKLAEQKKDIPLLEKKKSSDVIIKKNSSPDNVLLKAMSPENFLDNKQMDNGNVEIYEKTISKLKKKVLSSSTTLENTSSVKSNKIENTKIVKKGIKVKDSVEKDKDEGENTKKKRIVQVVRKVVKKSPDNLKYKEEKEKPSIKSTTKKAVTSKVDKSIETPTLIANIKKKSPENPIFLQNEKIYELRPKSIVDNDINKIIKNHNTAKDCNIIEFSKLDNANKNQSDLTEMKSNREKLKIDFSKIPQRNHRNITPPRRESPKSEIAEIPKFVQRSQSDDVSKRFIEKSKLTYKTIVPENNIITDKRIRSKDNIDLKTISETNNLLILKNENHSNKPELLPNEIYKENNMKLNSVNNVEDIGSNSKEEIKEVKHSSCSSKYRSSTDDLVSPTEDTESFDSWSICSADINHTCGDLHSPNSPTYSMYIYRDLPDTDSVIDRIRRKSFYCRFNDRKRKSSLNTTSPGISMSSMTLPRKFNFLSSRDINKEQKNKANNYSLPNRKHPKKYYSMYSDDATLFRKSPIERDRYSESGSSSSYSNELKLPSESCGYISSSYDPLRKYLPPTFNSKAERKKFHSSEFSTNNDLDSYRNSSIADNLLESSLNTSTRILPRRHSRSLSGFEPKTVAYYEELLAPNNSNYLRNRKISPVPCENCNNFENGFHNGSIELSQMNTDRWRVHSNKISRTDLIESIETEDCARNLIQSIHEPDKLPSNSLVQLATSSTIE